MAGTLRTHPLEGLVAANLREALRAEHSAETLAKQAREGRLDADAVAAVLAAPGQPGPPVSTASRTDRAGGPGHLAMEHGLIAWGELPISRLAPRR
jgi:hypothetical protein